VQKSIQVNPPNIIEDVKLDKLHEAALGSCEKYYREIWLEIFEEKKNLVKTWA
jgi:hypothetical protein